MKEIVCTWLIFQKSQPSYEKISNPTTTLSEKRADDSLHIIRKDKTLTLMRITGILYLSERSILLIAADPPSTASVTAGTKTCDQTIC